MGQVRWPQLLSLTAMSRTHQHHSCLRRRCVPILPVEDVSADQMTHQPHCSSKGQALAGLLGEAQLVPDAGGVDLGDYCDALPGYMVHLRVCKASLVLVEARLLQVECGLPIHASAMSNGEHRNRPYRGTGLSHVTRFTLFGYGRQTVRL